MPFPRVETKNLILRRMNYCDINDLFKMRKDAGMNEYIDVKVDVDTDETKAYIDKMNKGIDDNKWIIWAIEHKLQKRVIGTISIWNIDDKQETGELGYGIIPDFQGKGLMIEALLNVVNYGFSVMKLKTLDAYTEEHNVKSIKLLKRCNFNEINSVFEDGYFTAKVYHMIVYRLEKIEQDNRIKQDMWKDFKQYIELDVPEDFSFEQCMVYLNRSDIECLHKIKDGEFYKLLKVEEVNVIIKISMENQKLKVTFIESIPSPWIRKQMAEYVWEMFDLGVDISPFYKLAENDSIIKFLVDRYKGLRIIKMNDMFETMCWAIIGQQINLKFAYTLKKRLVENYGEKSIFEDEEYFLFPDFEVISKLQIEDLKQFQFTTRKAEYIIGLAKLFKQGDIKKEKLLLEKDYKKLRKMLTEIRGVGNWTADYTILKCFNINDAFPIADVGIHNAIKGILGLTEKPTINEIERLALNWVGWQSYATFYLWRSLND
jgi:DNA-3-methyladenine glycosylase II